MVKGIEIKLRLTPLSYRELSKAYNECASEVMNIKMIYGRDPTEEEMNIIEQKLIDKYKDRIKVIV